MKVKFTNGVVKDLRPHIAKAAIDGKLAIEVKDEKVKKSDKIEKGATSNKSK